MRDTKMKKFLHHTVCTATVEYQRWISSTKMLLLLLLIVYTKEQLVEPLLELTDLTGKPLQLLEPGIALMGSTNMMMVLPLIYLLLMGDFPRKDANMLFMISRVGKAGWFFGQLLYAVEAALTVLTAMIIFTTGWCAGNVCWNGGNWSDSVTKYYKETEIDFKFNLITGREYNQMDPVPVFLHSFCLVFLLLLFYSVILLLFSVYGNKVMGLAVCTILTAIGNSLSIFEIKPLMWFFPMAHTQIWLRNDELLKIQTVPLAGSYLYFAIGIFVVGTAAWIGLKKQKRLI